MVDMTITYLVLTVLAVLIIAAMATTPLVTDL